MWEDIFSRYIPEPNSGCFLWVGPVNTYGYGYLWDERRRDTLYAHRVAYEDRFGPISRGKQIDHKCRVRCCINPDHLEEVTVKENVLRGTGHSAENARKLACKRGHVFDEKNTYWMAPNKRSCRACHVLKQRKYMAQKRNQL